MRVLVCGGRDYADSEAVNAALSRLHAKRGITAIIHGDAKGADALARQWAEANGIPHLPFPANWNIGKRAGPIRNQRMLDEGKPDGVVAFPGGAGTADMVRRAKLTGLTVWQPCQDQCAARRQE